MDLFTRNGTQQVSDKWYVFTLLKYSTMDRRSKLVMEGTLDDLCLVTGFSSHLFHCGNAPNSPFQQENHTPLSKLKFIDHVCHALLAANIPAHLYTGQNFYIVATTTAALASIEDSPIQTLGCWKTSPYYLSFGEFVN